MKINYLLFTPVLFYITGWKELSLKDHYDEALLSLLFLPSRGRQSDAERVEGSLQKVIRCFSAAG